AHRGKGKQRRTGHRTTHTAGASNRERASPCRAAKGGRIDHAARQSFPAETGTLHPVNPHAVHDFLCWQALARRGVELPAGDHVYLKPASGEMKGQIREKPAGCGMIWEEKAVQKNEPAHEMALMKGLSANSRQMGGVMPPSSRIHAELPRQSGRPSSRAAREYDLNRQD